MPREHERAKNSVLSWTLYQILGLTGFGLFLVVCVGTVFGLFRTSSPRATRWITAISFSAVGLMSLISAFLYYWHHCLRYEQ